MGEIREKAVQALRRLGEAEAKALAVGAPYRWQGQVYKLWQQHDASGNEGWSPDQAVSLWDICHTRDPARAKPYVPPQGSRGLWQSGECCLWEGAVMRCLADDTAYSPGELPGAWEAAAP